MAFTRMSNHSYNDFTTWSTGSNVKSVTTTHSESEKAKSPSDLKIALDRRRSRWQLPDPDQTLRKNVFLGARILVERRRPTPSGAMAVACDGPSRAAGVSAGEFRFTPLGSGLRTPDELPTAAPRSGGGMLTQSTNGFIRST
ncbi:hypothetical protein OUZ56_009623 [Daphnia magna]|uniref:Uncharacterized protein n=1 Tax=Daphnia magna TaxID=35525 RepID=A0ABR0AGZ2_9CRUS|nr:hypothetical protein OUZ56_009623 [Daphnia magna]